MKAFLGMGLLGSNFVKAMRDRGEDVQIWNRTISRAEALTAKGAIVCESPAQAVKGAEYIHLAVKDDAAVDDVLEAARTELHPGAIIVDHTTTTKEGAIRRTAYWKTQGILYQHAPVFMGPSNARSATGFMLLSGEEDLITRLTPALEPMTGKLILLGPEAGKAAAVKLSGNAFLVCFAFGLRESLTVAAALGLSPEDMSSLLQQWNPASMTDLRLKKLVAKEHDEPSWELNMARKDTGLFLDAAANQQIALTLLPQIASVMDKWIENGFGHHDWTITGRDIPNPITGN